MEKLIAKINNDNIGIIKKEIQKVNYNFVKMIILHYI